MMKRIFATKVLIYKEKAKLVLRFGISRKFRREKVLKISKGKLGIFCEKILNCCSSKKYKE